MIRISKAAEYALIAVQQMAAEPNRLMSARDLSERSSLPAGLLAKILQRLSAAGILASEQGAAGGYRLVRDPDTVSFLELSQAVEGRLRVAACDVNGVGSCVRSDSCTVAGPVHELGMKIVGLLSDTSVGTLLWPDRRQGANV